ncbi:ABC transporter substrate-binding protein [Ilumatobacter coccineus]|uniref:Fe/B12 periplasmic-binding domain-containing protein n=1 Tax=Ilumatobacter coccineus (strain NBRC 103263 / KCTC 29153 / YM16-304) TaxID=1313172 RepID=A0A6C7E1T7_ILUCY|nr:ABC transporter substrate-binding protein [Ilumatobacter coccineus]BAN00831.1 hypothetical protein YM304_05170 [Ilumatobacter coccineus YM16-304]
MIRSAGSAFSRLVVLPVAAALAVASCSGSDDSSDSAASSAPVVTDAETGEPVFDPANPEGTAPPVPGTAVVLDDDVIIETEDGSIPTPTTEPPVDPNGPDAPPVDVTTTTAAPVAVPEASEIGRIVSMSSTHTETLFALGLGEFVVAVNNTSDFPAEAAAVRVDDLDADSADLSTLLALDPDVVIVGDDPTDLVGRLNESGVASFSGPPATSLDDVFAQIRSIASLVDRPDLAEGLIGSMQAEIDEIVGSIPAGSASAGERTYFHEIDPSLVTVSPGSFLDSIYGELGLTSIVADADPSGLAQLSPDEVIAADPDVIVLADAECCGVTIDVLAGRAGWNSIGAVSDGAVVALTDDLALRWGPRVVELMRLVAGGVAIAG